MYQNSNQSKRNHRTTIVLNMQFNNVSSKCSVAPEVFEYNTHHFCCSLEGTGLRFVTPMHLVFLSGLGYWGANSCGVEGTGAWFLTPAHPVCCCFVYGLKALGCEFSSLVYLCQPGFQTTMKSNCKHIFPGILQKKKHECHRKKSAPQTAELQIPKPPKMNC